jgi:hypothetical protein
MLIPSDGCPPLSWHILEVIINALMVIEVGTRWVAYGKVSRIANRQHLQTSIADRDNPLVYDTTLSLPAPASTHSTTPRSSLLDLRTTYKSTPTEIPPHTAEHPRPRPRALLLRHPHPGLQFAMLRGRPMCVVLRSPTSPSRAGRASPNSKLAQQSSALLT